VPTRPPTLARPTQPPATAGPGRATRRDEWTILASAGVLLVGLFLDGWSHANQEGTLESFLTPAHTMVFVGFVLCALAVAAVVAARRGPGTSVLATTPPAWRQAAVAVAAFGLAFLGDGLWHTVFGIESDIDALLSPTHLVLAGSMVVLFSTPLRSFDRHAAEQPSDHAEPGWIVAAAVSATTLVVAFFLLYAWTIQFGLGTAATVDALTALGGDVAELGEITGLVGTLVVTGVLVGGATALLRRGTPPRGALAMLLVTVPAAMSAIREFSAAGTLWTFVVAAVVVELMVHRPGRRTAPRTVAATWAVVCWTGYWVAVATSARLGWEPELYVGQVVSAAAFAWWLGARATQLPAHHGDLAVARAGS